MTKDSECSWQSLVKINHCTQAEEKEHPLSSSGKQREGQGQYEGPRAQHKAIPQPPARGDAEGSLADAEPTPTALLQLLQDWSHLERHNYPPAILPHFRQCSAHCGVKQSVSTAHSSLLSLLPTVTGNLFKSLASVFISKRTQLLPRHYFYFFYCLNYSLNCYIIFKNPLPHPRTQVISAEGSFFLSFKVNNNSIYAYFLFQICSQWIYNYGHTALTASIIRLSKCHFCSSWAFAMFYQSKKLYLIFFSFFMLLKKGQLNNAIYWGYFIFYLNSTTLL